MSVETPEPAEAADSQPWAPFIEAALATAHPRLYAENPFRVLGLSVLANGRDVLKRFEQLQMSSQLGTEGSTWAFSPSPVAEREKLRESVQRLKEPRARAIAEFFWFWPEDFPSQSEDPAYAALEKGDHDTAVALWASKPAEESAAGLHNLAVYHHYMALDQELSDTAVAPEDKTAWWAASIRYWKNVWENDRCWELFRRRISSIGDPQLVPQSVDHFRKLLPELLGSINATIAVRYAEAGDAAGAVRQLVALGDIFSDSSTARAALQRGIDPVLRRLDVRINDLKRRIAVEPRDGIQATRELILHSTADLKVIETLCGSDSEIFLETMSRMFSAGLDGVVSYQRATTDNESSLPLLIAFHSYPLNPEVAKRLAETYQVIYDNVLDRVNGAEGGEGEETLPLYARHYDLLRVILIPRVLGLELGETLLTGSCRVLVSMLKNIAIEARDERDDIDFAVHVLSTAEMLPLPKAEKDHIAEERLEFERVFTEQKQRELRLSLPTGEIEITRRGIVWNGQNYPISTIQAVRHGRTGEAAVGGETDYVIAWFGASDEAVLDSWTAFLKSTAAEEQYTQIVDAFYYFCVPVIIQRLLAELEAGGTVMIGECTIKKGSVILPPTGRLFRREQELPFSKISQYLEEGAWMIGPADQPRYREIYPTVHFWNAAIIGYVFDALMTR